MGNGIGPQSIQRDDNQRRNPLCRLRLDLAGAEGQEGDNAEKEFSVNFYSAHESHSAALLLRDDECGRFYEGRNIDLFIILCSNSIIDSYSLFLISNRSPARVT